MKFFKLLLPICFLVAYIILLNACSNTRAENIPVENTLAAKVNTADDTKPVSVDSSVFKRSLRNAKEADQAVFVVVTGNGITETERALTIAEGAKVLYKNASVIQMNRDEAANAQFVKEWRLSGAPLPLILAVSPKGMLAGGRILAQATAENIAALVPSPKKEEVLRYISSGKSVFLIVSNNKMGDKKSPLRACEKACFELQEKAKIVSVNTDDSSELVFLKELRIDPNITQPMTYVINAKGQVTGTFNGEVNSTVLVASAKKIISSSCCPPGSKQSCEPTT